MYIINVCICVIRQILSTKPKTNVCLRRQRPSRIADAYKPKHSRSVPSEQEVNMASITLITGGASSGKSRWAISYFRTCDNVLYMSTNPELQAETLHRLEYSNKENDVKWEIINNVNDPASLIKDHKFFIFDDLGGYVSNVMKETAKDINEITKEETDKVRSIVVNNIIESMNKVEALNGALVIITIEPGFSVIPELKSQLAFRDIMGFVNQRIANTAQEVYLSVSGIQFKIK